MRALQSNNPSPPSSETPMLPHAVTLSSSSMPCDIQGCRCCAVMYNKDQVFSTIMRTFYDLPRNSNCSTQIAIYLLECQQCKGKKFQYVGQTSRSIGKRMTGHRAAFASNQTDAPLPTIQKRKTTPSVGN